MWTIDLTISRCYLFCTLVFVNSLALPLQGCGPPFFWLIINILSDFDGVFDSPEIGEGCVADRFANYRWKMGDGV